MQGALQLVFMFTHNDEQVYIATAEVKLSVGVTIMGKTQRHNKSRSAPTISAAYSVTLNIQCSVTFHKPQTRFSGKANPDYVLNCTRLACKAGQTAR